MPTEYFTWINTKYLEGILVLVNLKGEDNVLHPFMYIEFILTFDKLAFYIIVIVCL